jgi:hypothetical protein
MTDENQSLSPKADTNIVAKVRPEVSQFLQNLKAKSAKTGRLIFALDATGSRQRGWDLATSLQARMFEEVVAIGGLSLQLIYYRGLAECRASDWVFEPARLLRWMQSVDCRSGMTQIGRVLAHAQKEHVKQPVGALAFVGDAVEEDADELVAKARVLGFPAFMFQEGDDPEVEATFRAIARASGGAYAAFDASSPTRLSELLRAAALFATGGVAALEAQKGSSNVILLEQLRKPKP